MAASHFLEDNEMAKLIPDVQIGTLGGTLLWLGLVIIIIVAVFTTGIGPVLIAAIPILLLVALAYIIGRRAMFRATRGKR